jgi:diadenosine tetraphosphatase ApaH/serine/threonine PP2A family protein phosphatase
MIPKGSDTIVRLGLLADVHGNLPALEACLIALDAQGIDALACLGDLVGYGPDPQACVELVRARADPCVLGNHDAAIATGEELESFVPLAHRAAVWTRGQLDEEARSFLAGLPRTVTHSGVVLAHGAPGDTHRYLLGRSEITEVLEASAHRFVACGHTHSPLVQALDHGHVTFEREFPASRTVPLPPGGAVFINPGSVGQPRDGVPYASCAVLDTDKRRVELLRADYDIEAVCERIKAGHLPELLAERLRRGV